MKRKVVKSSRLVWSSKKTEIFKNKETKEVSKKKQKSKGRGSTMNSSDLKNGKHTGISFS